jgi:CheY-like chemotaxis protein
MVETISSALNRNDANSEERLRTTACRPLHVLLAEDNRFNQQFATLVLNKAGHSVEIAANGVLAVEAVRRTDFDVVLMDIQMPELDGVGATRQIRAMAEPKGSVPIIAVTAHTMAGAREEYLAAGMDDYISKPFQPAQLLYTLAKVTDRDPKFVPATGAQMPGEQMTAAQISELPALDLEQIDTFGSVFSVSKIRTLASLYMIDVEARLALLTERRSMGDFDGVSRQAHMIVSTAGNIGAKQTSALAHVLEISCMDQDNALSDPLIEALHASCEASSRALKRWLDTEPPIAALGRLSSI